MILRYIDAALERARFERLEDGQVCATVPGLRGVLAVGHGIRECRAELAEVIEEWVLVRIAQRLSIPRIGGVTVKVKRAS
jgi:predicted RNase H-like HicB family nuclease